MGGSSGMILPPILPLSMVMFPSSCRKDRVNLSWRNNTAVGDLSQCLLWAGKRLAFTLAGPGTRHPRGQASFFPFCTVPRICKPLKLRSELLMLLIRPILIKQPRIQTKSQVFVQILSLFHQFLNSPTIVLLFFFLIETQQHLLYRKYF